ncbi:MAG: glycoside hydrolase family 97 protein [Bacteroidales bacterium]|nr:glycoside hydrolase family 97 protein [Bacteroidales bacterium]
MKKTLLSALLLLCVSAFAQKQYTLQSPDGKISVTVWEEESEEILLLNSQTTPYSKLKQYCLRYSVKHEETVVLDKSDIAMMIDDGGVGCPVLGVSSKPSITSAKTKSVNQTVKAPFYKRAEIQDQYNELTLSFKGNYKVIFRAYNEGVAYRFQTDFKKPFKVIRETTNFNFDNDYHALIPYVLRRAGQEGDLISQQFYNSFENTYTHTNLSQMDPEKLAFLPLLVELKDGKKAVITEADLEDFPGLYLYNPDGENGLSAMHAGYPKTREQGGHNNLQWLVKERESYIAKVDGKRAFPWRCIVISENDKELADSDLVYLLASPSRIEDDSWIQPGKVAWDWWNAWNIYGVDFKAGINNDTYKYYIDFASQYGIEYVILDEGWAVNKQADLFQVVPEIDLEELIRYGLDRNVGIVLWVGYAAIDKDMEHVCQHYSDMGVRGFKVDFMDGDDQMIVDFYYRMAETAARHQLFVDFHGAYKPTGLHRTWPNVLNHEGVYGLEQAKWDNQSDLVTNEVTIPFIRMVAGPMDYTQGAMRNANKNNFAAVYTEPMSQGTRCRQLAEYVIFESPFNMLCDSPSNYLNEDECTQFIASVPTVWDETVVLDGKVGEYLVIARRKGYRWYVGAITNWDERDLVIDLSVLPNFGAKSGRIFRDGTNANRVAKDYVAEQIQVMGNKVKLHLAKGGGAVMVF